MSFRNRGTHNLSLSKERDMMLSSLGAETPHSSKLQLWPEFVLAFYTDRKEASKSIKYLWWKTRVSNSCWSQYQDFWACRAWCEGRVNELVQGVSWVHCYCQRTSLHALVAVESTGAQKTVQASIFYVLFISSHHATWRKYFLFVPTHPDLKAKRILSPAYLYAGHVHCVLGALYYSGSFVYGVL